MILFFHGLGYIFSNGLITISDKLTEDGLTCRHFPYTAQPGFIKNTKVVVGHSFGVPAMFNYLRSNKIECPLAISIDPSQYVGTNLLLARYGNTPAPGISRLVNFWQKNEFPLSIGGQTLPGAENILIPDTDHGAMDDHPVVQKKVRELILAL